MEVALVYSPALDAYDLGPQHPLRPERVSRAIALMEAHGLIAKGALRPVPPRHATRDELLLVHTAEYVDTVMRASEPSGRWLPARGIGPGDTPAFPGMHDAAALVAGATTLAVEMVTDGRPTRALSPAGGLHHAHSDRAAGFCVYNDVAVAIAVALRQDPDLRVLYVDIDAHHGDGVQDAFYEQPRVLTISLHESGRYLYPGTGAVTERGAGAGLGRAINLPLPPLADDDCYQLAFDEVVVPAARAFGPDLIVAQCGADAHWTDPLTSLGVSLEGFRSLYERIVDLAEAECAGRLVACGGGGYSWETVVPRAWTLLAAALTGMQVPAFLSEDPGPRIPASVRAELLESTEEIIEKLRHLGAI